jgi:hypothetical protein
LTLRSGRLAFHDPGLLYPPGRGALIKEEDRTWVWRDVRPGASGTPATPIVVKLYRKRGRWNAVRSRLSRFRVEREWRRLRHLERWAIPCTPPIGWATGWDPEHGAWEFLLMREVERARPLGDALQEEPGLRVDLVPLFQMVRRMHESGFLNQTLYVANILMAPNADTEEAFYLSDVPRSWTFPGSLVGTRRAQGDLLDLLFTLLEVGVDPGDIPLEAYGEGGIAWPSLPMADPKTKRKRWIRDGVARLCWAAAWTSRGFLPRARPGRPQR